MALVDLAPETATVTFGSPSGDPSLNAFVKWLLDSVVVVDGVVVGGDVAETVDGVLLVADSSAVVGVDPHGLRGSLPFPPAAATVDFIALTVAGFPEISDIAISRCKISRERKVYHKLCKQCHQLTAWMTSDGTLDTSAA